nr:MAG TPA: hypothetical protein [Crassvirales sp.]
MLVLTLSTSCSATLITTIYFYIAIFYKSFQRGLAIC